MTKQRMNQMINDLEEECRKAHTDWWNVYKVNQDLMVQIGQYQDQVRSLEIEVTRLQAQRFNKEELDTIIYNSVHYTNVQAIPSP